MWRFCKKLYLSVSKRYIQVRYTFASVLNIKKATKYVDCEHDMKYRTLLPTAGNLLLGSSDSPLNKQLYSKKKHE